MAQTDSANSLRQTLPLHQLAPRQCAVVVAVEGQSDDADRLKAMGLCVGRKVELVKGGDPLIIRVLGSRLGLSARLAQRVRVDACSDPVCRAPQD